MEQPIKIVSLQPKNELEVRFWPTDVCNFNCSYCFPDSKNGIYRYPKNIDTIIQNFNYLFDVYNEKFGKTKFNLNIVGGGEPTIWPHFTEFCKGIKSKHNVVLKTTTNGSRSLRWWKEHSKYLSKVTLSVHHEFADIDHTIQVLDYLYEQKILGTALVLMDASEFDKCKAIVDKMLSTSKHPWFIEAKPVVDFPGKDNLSYTSEQQEYMKIDLKRIPDGDLLINFISDIKIYESVAIYDTGEVIPKKSGDYINENVNYFNGWKCDVSLENLVIRYDGTISGNCNADIFKDCNLNMFSENFIEDFNKFKFNLKTFTCNYVNCSCQPDTHITKWKV
jgi:organic radical activating enzyme